MFIFTISSLRRPYLASKSSGKMASSKVFEHSSPMLKRNGLPALPTLRFHITGGTEVGAVFLGSSIAEPIKACSVGGPTLGMAMDVVDPDGRSLVDTGEVGELVCRKPFPGMTRGFWGDPERYLDTYWRRFPGVWTHGDWASVDADGGKHVTAVGKQASKMVTGVAFTADGKHVLSGGGGSRDGRGETDSALRLWAAPDLKGLAAGR